MFMVHANFFQNGDQKAYFEEKLKRKNQLQVKQGVIGIKLFFEERKTAEHIVEKIVTKEIDLKKMQEIFFLVNNFMVAS